MGVQRIRAWGNKKGKDIVPAGGGGKPPYSPRKAKVEKK